MGPPEPFTKVRSARLDFLPVGTSLIRMIGPSENRTGVILGGRADGTTTWSTNPAATPNQGLVIPPNAGPIVLTYETAGELVRQAWYAVFSVAGTNNIGFVEVLSD